MADILIVEDDRRINELIRRTLQMTGHKGLTSHSGGEALCVLEKMRPDLVLLDLGLPDMDGFKLMKELKEIGGFPVICVTARDEISDRVKGLIGGAEDYIVKPFAVEELLARIQVVLRRERKADSVFKIGNITLDVSCSKVWKNEMEVKLTYQEFKLLKILIQNRNLSLSRERLIELAWGMDYDGNDRTVDIHIQRLRKKLELEDRIKTIFKYDYRLDV